jgi:hypothetical protein
VILLDRLRRLFRPRFKEPDHPLSEEERHDKPAATTFDERARLEEEFVGDDFDPDEPRSGRL